MTVGWHESRELLQQPPHLLIRVQDGKIMLEGSSSTFKETDCNSGMHLAGVGMSAFDLSSPPNLPAKRERERERNIVNVTVNVIPFAIPFATFI